VIEVSILSPGLLNYLNGKSKFSKEGLLGRCEAELQENYKVVRTLIEDLDKLPSLTWKLVGYNCYSKRVGGINYP
jgi:hypothetical protein